MHVLHFVHRYRPARGGAENYLAGINRGLIERGHQVTVVTTDLLDFERLWNPHKAALSLHEEEIDGVKILRFPVRYLPLSRLTFPLTRRATYLLSRLPYTERLAARLASWTPLLPELADWVENNDVSYDLVAGMTITLEGVVEQGRRLADRLNIPFVVYPLTHLGAGKEPGTDQLSRMYTMRHQRDLVLNADGMVGITQTECEYYAGFGKSAMEMRVAPPGIDSFELGGGDLIRDELGIQGKIVLSISTMDEEKGTPHTIEACRLLWGRGVEFSLVLAGSLTSRFRDYLEKIRTENFKHLYLLGPVSETVKWQLLDAADLLCMPSRTESFGIVYLEAWAHRLPVIGANTWGIKDDVILPGQDGLLVDYGDPGHLAESIQLLLDDPALRDRLGNAGYSKVKSTYNWPHSIETIDRFYKLLITQKRSV